jgi:hypothetical protein
MTKAALILCVGILLTTACENRAQPSPADLGKRISALEADHAALRTQADNLQLKSRIVSGLLHRSPLEDFFASPEFWENTYDSGQADCANRCIRANTETRAACAAITDVARRQKCYDDALASVTACQRGCRGL